MPYKDPQKRREMGRKYSAVWASRHPEKRKEATKDWRQRNWDKHLATAARYRERHRDRVRKSMNASDAKRAVTDKRKEFKKAYKLWNIKQTRIWEKTGRTNRALRKARNGGKCEPDVWLGRCLMYGWKCAYCRKPLDLGSVEIEHVIPIARGGTGWGSNLVPACRTCNTRKNTKRILPLKLRRFKESI